MYSICMLLCYYCVIIKGCVCALQGGNTPLHWAACNGHGEVVDTLVNAGATVDVINNVSYVRRAIKYKCVLILTCIELCSSMCLL